LNKLVIFAEKRLSNYANKETLTVCQKWLFKVRLNILIRDLNMRSIYSRTYIFSKLQQTLASKES